METHKQQEVWGQQKSKDEMDDLYWMTACSEKHFSIINQAEMLVRQHKAFTPTKAPVTVSVVFTIATATEAYTSHSCDNYITFSFSNFLFHISYWLYKNKSRIYIMISCDLIKSINCLKQRKILTTHPGIMSANALYKTQTSECNF